MEYKYKSAICAGTFDKLHAGHKEFLRFAFSISEKVYVTITSDKYTQIHKPDVSSFSERVGVLKHFLKEEEISQRAEVIPIDDVYGISLDPSLSIDAIVVTDDTLKGADLINHKRESLGFSPLAVEIVPFTHGETQMRIASTHIRNGIITPEGSIAVKKEFMQADLFLPFYLREKLQKPFGKLIDPKLVSLNSSKLIAVGDVTVNKLHKAGYSQVLSVIDFVVERQKQNKSLNDMGFTGKETVLHTVNPPATLTPMLWKTLEEALSKIKNEDIVVIVEGEEDLAVLPLLLIAPVGFIICYGQPHEGMIMVPVTAETKEQAIILLSDFIRSTRGY